MRERYGFAMFLSRIATLMSGPNEQRPETIRQQGAVV